MGYRRYPASGGRPRRRAGGPRRRWPEGDPTAAHRGRPGSRWRERRPRARRHPLPHEAYRGPGAAGRYGGAPVPYGPDHTYNFHYGDYYGYGPDFRRGEERIGHVRAWRRPCGDYEPK